MSETTREERAPFGPRTGIAEAGRCALAQQLAVIEAHDSALRDQASAKSVHETRKAIRRTRTLFKLLKPYFVAHTFRRYRRCLKNLMRPLGQARDLEVCLHKLQRFRQGAGLPTAEVEALVALEQAWQAEKSGADEAARQAARQPTYRDCLAVYAVFTATAGAGLPAARNRFAPSQIGHLAPVHIYERLAAVRAFEGQIAAASTAELHQLRICFKELRYTLEFFSPVLGREIERILADLNGIQDHLGDLNDTQVALALLAGREELEAAVQLYRGVQKAEMARLVDTFGPVWDTFNDAAWRRQLSAALSVL